MGDGGVSQNQQEGSEGGPRVRADGETGNHQDPGQHSCFASARPPLVPLGVTSLLLCSSALSLLTLPSSLWPKMKGVMVKHVV